MKKVITVFKGQTTSQTTKQSGGLTTVTSNIQTPTTSTTHRDNVAMALDVVIETIQAVKDLIPITTAKSILAGILIILVHLRTSMKNKDSLKDLLRNCEDIYSTLALATKGADKDIMKDVLKNALGSLESSICDLQARVEEVLQRGRVRRLLSASINEKNVADWTNELNRILISLSAKLNIVAVIRLEQIYELLKQPDFPTLTPDPPPPSPAICFGRDEMLCQLKNALLRDENVALIGPGGIGKSTIAMAVMNDQSIIQSYRRRFFVTYDGMDPTTISFGSFMDRISNVLGLPMSSAEGERQVKSNLGLSRVLLVLDNAETFEDASNRDEARRISDFISYIANTADLAVVLTSRTSSNARRVRWTLVEIPPLERGPARQSFRAICQAEISDNDIDRLLAEVDFHPLSISILAYTARESRWTTKVLLARWNTQQSRFLKTGDGKDNLGFTIRLSLESPSVKALGNDALQVLRITAFFPQGINQDHLTELFPTISDISFVVDTLSNVSLISSSPSGTFLTALAPVRLFLRESFPIASTELGDVRRLYYDLLQEITKEKDLHVDLFVSDHLNIEHLIAFDIVHPAPDIRSTAQACRQFLFGLLWHRLRPTLLSPLVSSFPEDLSEKKDTKARCLDVLGHLYFELSIYAINGAAHLAASSLFVAIGSHTMAAHCISSAARSFHLRGYFSRARQILGDFICSTSWQYVDEEYKTKFYYTLDLSLMNSSSECTDKLFLRSVDHSVYGLDSRMRHWRARMYHGHNTPEEVERKLESFRSDCMLSSNPWNRWYFLVAVAEAAFLQQKFTVIQELTPSHSHESTDGNFRLALGILRFKATVASAQGDYNFARSILSMQSHLDTLGVVATPSSIEFLQMLYVQGLNELYAGDHSKARQLLTDIIGHCDNCDEIRIRTWCERALGELDLVLGHKTDSNQHFAHAVELCGEAGAPPELLGICNPMIRLDDDRFPGWKRFLREQTRTV